MYLSFWPRWRLKQRILRRSDQNTVSGAYKVRADAVEQTDQLRIQRFGGRAVCGNRAAIQRKNPAGLEQGVLRIVAGEKDGVALRTERGNLTEYADLIAKVQRGSRLVHQ